MPPIPEPNATPEHCLNCGLPVAQPRPPFCPQCGTSLRKRPLWQTLLASLGAVLLGLAALGLGGVGACFALFSMGGGVLSSDALWSLGVMLGGVLCAVAAGFILKWLLKKPKR